VRHFLHLVKARRVARDFHYAGFDRRATRSSFSKYRYI